MAYKVSYKVVSEQGEQLKNIAKDMDTFASQLDKIVAKLGNDELLQSVRTDLNKFRKQLEEEKTVLNLAGQIIVDVIQSYTGVEKKSVQKVDKAKAHNRDFYKRPVAVASAGGAAAGATVNINTATATSYQSTTNVYSSPSTGAADFTSGAVSDISAAGASGIAGAAGAAMSGGATAAVAGIAAAAAGVAAAGGAVAGAVVVDKIDKKKEETGAEEQV